MGARVPCLLLLALILGSAACANARFTSDSKQYSALSRSKDDKPPMPRPMGKPECVCKPKDPHCKCDVSGCCWLLRSAVSYACTQTAVGFGPSKRRPFCALEGSIHTERCQYRTHCTCTYTYSCLYLHAGSKMPACSIPFQ